MMELKRFNDAGIVAFREWLEKLRADPTMQPPYAWLEEPKMTESIEPTITATPDHFENRMQFAQWLHDAATAANTKIPLHDAGFWAWLTLLLFDQVCPLEHDERSVKEAARYIPELQSKRRYYRHALLGPYLVFKPYEFEPDKTAALLCGSISKLTDEAYRLFVENQLVVYPCAVTVLTNLYFDTSRFKLRVGSQSKTKPGSIRRFARVLSQYARTYDLDILSARRLTEMLPDEFDHWRVGCQPDL